MKFLAPCAKKVKSWCSEHSLNSLVPGTVAKNNNQAMLRTVYATRFALKTLQPPQMATLNFWKSHAESLHLHANYLISDCFLFFRVWILSGEE